MKPLGIIARKGILALIASAHVEPERYLLDITSKTGGLLMPSSLAMLKYELPIGIIRSTAPCAYPLRIDRPEVRPVLVYSLHRLDLDIAGRIERQRRSVPDIGVSIALLRSIVPISREKPAEPDIEMPGAQVVARRGVLVVPHKAPEPQRVNHPRARQQPLAKRLVAVTVGDDAADRDEDARVGLLVESVEAARSRPALRGKPSPVAREVRIVCLGNEVSIRLYQHIVAVAHEIHRTGTGDLLLAHPISRVGI